MKKLIVTSVLCLALVQPVFAQENQQPVLLNGLDRLTQLEQRILDDNGHWRVTLDYGRDINDVLQRLNRKTGNSNLKLIQAQLDTLLRERPSMAAADQVLVLLDQAKAEIELLAQ